MKRVGLWLVDPVHFRKINGWLAIVWFVLAFPICVFLSESVPFLVFISVYTVMTGHLRTWQSARVEARQEADDTEQKVKDLHRVTRTSGPEV